MGIKQGQCVCWNFFLYTTIQSHNHVP